MHYEPYGKQGGSPHYVFPVHTSCLIPWALPFQAEILPSSRAWTYDSTLAAAGRCGLVLLVEHSCPVTADPGGTTKETASEATLPCLHWSPVKGDLAGVG